MGHDEAKLAPQPMQLRMLPSSPHKDMQRADHAMHMARVVRERAQLERDEARELLAKERYAAARRKASPFHEAKWTEGCPEGTPGCATRSSLGYLERPRSGIKLNMPTLKTAGDHMVPADKALRQIPHLY